MIDLKPCPHCGASDKEIQELKEKLDKASRLLIDCEDEGICDLGLYKRVNDFLKEIKGSV